jgi:DNA-binding NtrC family response regulator
VKKAILCVDDDKKLLQAHQLLLEPDFLVGTAESGNDALAMIVQRGRLRRSSPTSRCRG